METEPFSQYADIIKGDIFNLDIMTSGHFDAATFWWDVLSWYAIIEEDQMKWKIHQNGKSARNMTSVLQTDDLFAKQKCILLTAHTHTHTRTIPRRSIWWIFGVQYPFWRGNSTSRQPCLAKIAQVGLLLNLHFFF